MKKTLWLVPVVLLLILVLAITSSVNAQAEFEVGQPTISPGSVKEGDIVTITTAVTNIGDAEGTCTLELKINDEVVETKEVSLEADQSQTVSFTVTGDVAGEYIVDLEGWPGLFTVKKSFWAMFDPWLWAIVGAIAGVLVLFIIILVVMPSGRKQPRAATGTKGAARQAPLATPIPTPTAVPPMPMPTPTAMPSAMPGVPPPPTPSPMPGPIATPHPPAARAMFFVSNLSITPNQAKEREAVTISMIVSNNGTESGKYSMVLRINGVVEGITELSLPPGTSQPAVFSVTKDVPGTYYVEADGLTSTFTIIALSPAHFSVSNLIIAPERVKQGDSIMVSAVVTNSGEIAGSYSVVLKVKGVAESIEEVNLGPGVNHRVAFTITKDEPGFYQVDLEGLSGRFVVEMEWNE